MAENFVRDEKKGSPGVSYVIKHLEDLVGKPVQDAIDTSAEKISGKDCVAVIDGQQKNIEVKTIWNFLTRTNDFEDPGGTLPFELWSNRDRKYPGWLLKMISPDDYENVVCPDILIFLLVAYEQVYACIAFENVPELINKLKSLANEYHFDLASLPYGDKEWLPHSSNEDDFVIISENVWLVPFMLLEDLAAVTMIGEAPRRRPEIVSGSGGIRTCSAYTQYTRLQKLTSLSVHKKALPLDAEFQFDGDEADHVFATIDQALRCLESPTFSVQCETLSKKEKLLDSYKYILSNMLAHEYPSRQHDGKNYFPISYFWLQDWCVREGKSRAIQTWVNHIKTLIIFGLLDYYQPPRNSDNPIDIMVNVNNTGQRSVGYYAPVKLSLEVLYEADRRALEYSLGKVRLSSAKKELFLRIEDDFQRVNQAYGNDGREISKAKDYVEAAFFDLMLEIIGNKGYALPEEISERVGSKLKRNLHFKNVDNTKTELTEDEINELKRQSLYWNKLQDCNKQIAAMAKEIGCEYKKLSKADQSYIPAAKKLKPGTMIVASPVTIFDEEKIHAFEALETEKKNQERRKKYTQKKKVKK